MRRSSIILPTVQEGDQFEALCRSIKVSVKNGGGMTCWCNDFSVKDSPCSSHAEVVPFGVASYSYAVCVPSALSLPYILTEVTTTSWNRRYILPASDSQDEVLHFGYILTTEES